jgi:hypothetical protein
MGPADEVVSNIALHFRLLNNSHCDDNPVVREGYGYHGQTCGVWTWVVGCADMVSSCVGQKVPKLFLPGTNPTVS